MHCDRKCQAPDGAMVTKLLHPRHDPVQRVSVAEATVPSGGRTSPHRHPSTEEIYYTLSGCGQLSVGSRVQEMTLGSVHLIPPGMEHWVRCLPGAPLRFLCICSPPYSDDDTELTGAVQV